VKLAALLLGWFHVCAAGGVGLCGQSRPRDAFLAEALGGSLGDFTRIAAVRGLSDGSVLVLDQGRDQPLVRVDFATGRQTIVARRGAGPGEFRSAARLIPLPGDSTLLPDGAQRRWVVLAGSKVAQTTTADAYPLAGQFVGWFVGADDRGRILAVEPTMVDGSTALPGLADSVLVAVVDRRTGVVDTMFRMSGGKGRIVAAKRRTPAGMLSVLTTSPLAVDDQALMFIDGWIGLARANPYRAIWIDPAGRRISGPTIDTVTVRVDDEERRATMKRRYSDLPDLRENPLAFSDWPAELPPFGRDALSAAPDGSLVVHRMLSSRARFERYDVVDRSGRLVRTINLPLGARLVGFGARSVYVATKGDDDIERLSRHPWP